MRGQRKIYDVSDDVMSSSTCVRDSRTGLAPGCLFFPNLDSRCFTPPNCTPFVPIKSPRAPLSFSPKSPFQLAPRPTNFFAGARRCRRCILHFPASTVGPRALDHVHALPHALAHLPHPSCAFSLQRNIASVHDPTPPPPRPRFRTDSRCFQQNCIGVSFL